MKALQDQNGNISSKRIMAFIGLIYAMLMGILGGTETVDSQFALELSKGFLMFSGAMGGVSTAEFFKKG